MYFSCQSNKILSYTPICINFSCYEMDSYFSSVRKSQWMLDGGTLEIMKLKDYVKTNGLSQHPLV